jgi:hypothetical protein
MGLERLGGIEDDVESVSDVGNLNGPARARPSRVRLAACAGSGSALCSTANASSVRKKTR